MPEIFLVIDGDTVTSGYMADTEEYLMKQLIQKAKEQGADPVEIRYVPCG